MSFMTFLALARAAKNPWNGLHDPTFLGKSEVYQILIRRLEESNGTIRKYLADT